MQDLMPRIIPLLKKYMRDQATWVRSSTALSELGIDRLDLPIIFLDIEDLFGVQVHYLDGAEELTTVGSLVARIVSSLEANAKPRAPRPRRKSNWMSTEA
jgi:acyl carrier protein